MCRVVVRNRGKERAGISDKKINERLDVAFGIWSPILGVGVYFLTDAPEPGGIKPDEVAELEFPVEVEEDCQTPAYCIHAWSREWTESVPRIIHHPEVPSDSAALLLALDATDIDGLCKPCKDLSVSWMWEKKWVSREEELIAEGVAALMALQTGSPLRACLNGSTVEATSDSVDGDAY
ncbi:hypothetical protein C8J57DRAFT_1226244 [Mycena rebaudengoi]|nr:hypothetical protein C8J57DRAFT_1226244 [Mycena rebaudengoi]